MRSRWLLRNKKQLDDGNQTRRVWPAGVGDVPGATETKPGPFSLSTSRKTAPVSAAPSACRCGIFCMHCYTLGESEN